MRRAAILLSLACILFSACASSRSQRISRNEAQFNQYTPAQRKMIRTGQVAVGFDQSMVRLALGEPSRERTVEAANGKQIVWEYTETSPNLGFSLGAGAGSRSGVGGGVGVSARPDKDKVYKRVVFDRRTGKVARVESYD